VRGLFAVQKIFWKTFGISGKVSLSLGKLRNMSNKTNLNERDAEIAQLLADGYTAAEIAKEMGVNLRTLESRIAVAKKKALSKTLPQFTANYLRKGLIK